MSLKNDIPKIMSIKNVSEITGLAKSTIYKWIGNGQFPPPIRLGAKKIGWLNTTVISWINQRTP